MGETDGGHSLAEVRLGTLNSEDGFEPEGWIWMATLAAGGRLIVLWAVLDGYVSFVVESQTGGPPRKLEEQWNRTEWARPRMPRTADQLQKLTDEVIAWIQIPTESTSTS